MEGKNKVLIKEKNNKKNKLLGGVKFTILAVILIVIFCVSLTPKTLQNDTYYSIKIGEHIQYNGIDMKDPFSWHQDLNYTYPHWLYDFLTFKVYDAFGFMGIYVSTCILSSILGIMIYFVNCKLTKKQITPFIVTIGVMYLIEGYIAARAQLVTFILFILAVFLIEKFIENRKIGYGIGLVLISTLIANIHVAVWPFLFILFLPYIGEYFIACLGDFLIYRKFERKKLDIKLKLCKENETEKRDIIKNNIKELDKKVEKIKIKRSQNVKEPYKIKITKNKNVKWLILVMVICVFTGLLTPLGDTPYTYLSKTLEGNTTNNINEHLPMTIADQPEVLCAIIIILSIVIFTKTKIKLNDLFMIGGLILLMLYTRRQLSMFAIIGSVVLCRLLIDMAKTYVNDTLNKINGKWTNKIIAFLLITCVLTLSYYKFKDKRNDFIIDESTYPVKACDYILENIDLRKARFYNEYNYGSYMLYRGIPVFIDSRADLYAPEFSGREDDIFMDFINVSGIGEFYEDIFEKYNITHAIMYSNAKISMIIDKTNDENYKKIYSDDHFVIYERLNAKTEEQNNETLEKNNETEEPKSDEVEQDNEKYEKQNEALEQENVLEVQE